MLLESDLNEDERVQKTCMSLSDIGFEVHVIFPESNTVKKFNCSNVFLYTFDVNRFVYKKLFATCLIQPYYFLLWKFHIKRLIKDIESFGIIYIHDLPLLSIGVDFKNLYKMKLVSDQHEFYTDFIKHTPHMLTMVGKLVGKWSQWERYEKINLPIADLVVTVFDNLKERYIQQMPALTKKIVTLPNSPLKSYYIHKERNPAIIHKFIKEKSRRAIFVGAVITRERRLDLMIDALPEIIKLIPDFRFMILGNVHSSYNLEEHIKQNKVESYVELIGKVPNFDIPDYLHCSSIGINVHDTQVGQVVHETIFTKFYQYLGMKNAIVTTRLKVMADIVEHYGIGKVVDSGPGDIATAITDLLLHPDVLHSCINNIENVKDIFWEDTALEWIDEMTALRDSIK